MKVHILFIFIIIYLIASGLSCGTQDLPCDWQDLFVVANRLSSCGVQVQQLWHTDSLVVHRLQGEQVQ